MGETLRRITGKAAMRQLKEHITPYLEPLQYGAGSNRGCAHIHTLLSKLLQRKTDFVLLKCDVSNAFNSMSRDAFMREVESKFPALLPLVSQFYLEPSNLIVRGSDGEIRVLKSVSGQQQGDTLGSLLFSLGLQPILLDVSAKFPTCTIRGYVDDIHLCGPDADVAKAFTYLHGQLKGINLKISFGKNKTAAWSPRWATSCAAANESAVGNLTFGADTQTGEPIKIHRYMDGLKTLGTFIGSETYILHAALAHINSTTDGALNHACTALVQMADDGREHSTHIANVLLLKCAVPKVVHLMESLPQHIAAEVGTQAKTLLLDAYRQINELSPAEMAVAEDRITLPTSLRGCGIRSPATIATAAFLTSRIHTAKAVIDAITAVENAIAAAAAAPSNGGDAGDVVQLLMDGADDVWLSPAPATQPAAHPPEPPDPPDPPSPPSPPSPSASTTGASPPPPTRALRNPYDDVMDDIDSALDSLPDCARELVDLAPLKEDFNLKPYNNLQRKLTHAIESKKADEVRAEVRDRGRKDAAHLNSCLGSWILGAPIAHLRYTNCQYKTRLRRYLRLSIPICAAVRKSVDGKPADSFGDFTLSTVFSCKGANQWITMHNAVTSFLFKCAKQARLGDVDMEKIVSTSRHRPGDVRVKTTMHGWKAAEGKKLLMDATICSAVCDTNVDACAADVGGGAAAAAEDKLRKAKAANCIPTDSYFLPLPFESEGYACKEVGQLLMAWAKIWAQGRDETALAAKKLHHRWMTELHCIHARHLANNITDRANLAFEMRLNKDGVCVDLRPPLTADVDVFSTR
jgi:hypothetical protein